MVKNAILIAGSTASGKSALAIELALQNDGVIINADSMQVYDVLNVLSARPQADELIKAPHHLYGYITPSIRHSTGAWLRDVAVLMSTSQLVGRTLIFVGGTGLYFQALTDGFIEIPPVALEIVTRIENEILPLDRLERLELLRERDPEMAEQLHEPDQQRLVRALSVLEATGQSLAYWQSQKQLGLLNDYALKRIVLNVERDILRARIAKRFELMLQSGAVEEVRTLMALHLDPCLPAMKAIGVRQIADWLVGNLSREEAIGLSVTATHQYAKRQRTWFRKRMADWDWRE